jgi:VCBS repeat-containing protein
VVTGAVLASATEGAGSVTISALANASDADGNSLTAIVDSATLPAGVTFDTTSQTFSFDPANAAYNSLAQGQKLDVTIVYGVTDGETTTNTSAVFTITGTNDVPVVSVSIAAAATEGAAIATVSALTGAIDADGNTLSAIVNSGTLPAGVTFDATTQTFSLDPNNAAYNSLAQGQTVEVSISYEVTDGLANVPTSVVFTVTGTNDAPVAGGQQL